MSSGSRDVFNRDLELKRAMEGLAGSVSSRKQQGLMFEMGGDDGFGSYQKWSDTEVSFKEYDDLGFAKVAGKIEFTRENGTIAFTLDISGEANEVIEGWLALEKQEDYVIVYFPWRLASDDGRQFLFKKVLGGYEYIKEAHWGIDRDNGFAFNGVGLSGEEEGKVGMVVKNWGKI